MGNQLTSGHLNKKWSEGGKSFIARSNEGK